MNGNLLLLLAGILFSAIVIAITIIANKTRHPKALVVLFFTEMWERFSFYGMKALLIAYMSKELLMKDEPCSHMYGVYMALVYTFPIVGGYVADKYLGFRKTILLGGILMAIGHLVLALPSKETFFIGLGFLIGGNGFFKPNISSFLGKFYETKKELRDEAYSIFYMGINVGALLGGLMCSYLGTTFGWHWGFGVAGILMIAGLIVFLINFPYLEDKGLSPIPEVLSKPVFSFITQEHLIYIGGFLAIPFFIWSVTNYEITEAIFSYSFTISILILLYQCYLYRGNGGRNLFVATILIAASSLFWAFFEQGGGSLNFFAERNVDTMGLDYKMVNNNLNPFFVILLSPVFGFLWTYLERKHGEVSFSTRFALGFIILGSGFYAFILGSKLANAEGMVDMGWFALGYLLISVGEMLVSPVGLSMVSKLSPPKITGMVMGVWFLASGFGHSLAGKIGAMMAIPEGDHGEMLGGFERLAIYSDVFSKITWGCVITGVVIWVFFYVKHIFLKAEKGEEVLN
ncbi:MAG: peptide MFS transporter [Bacteroidetes bacterium]|nr:peptide MFS transporter [Bacteroidota bacterium]